MNEKVLGFREKDLVSVVSVKWLEKWCDEQINKIGLKGKSKAAKAHNELVAVYVKDILSAAKKESEKK